MEEKKLKLKFYKPPKPIKKGRETKKDYDIIMSHIENGDVSEDFAMYITDIDKPDNYLKGIQNRLYKKGWYNKYKVQLFGSGIRIFLREQST